MYYYGMRKVRENNLGEREGLEWCVYNSLGGIRGILSRIVQILSFLQFLFFIFHELYWVF